MRIAEIHVYQLDLPLSGKTYRMSEGSYTALDSTVVQVVSDTGVSGWGETCPVGPTYSPEHALGARAALIQMAPGLIGKPVPGPARCPSVDGQALQRTQLRQGRDRHRDP